MGKSLQELKEMIDSVIMENGKGQITAQALNLVLNEMSEALSEMGGSGGGGGGHQIYIPMIDELTAEQIAFNAQQFAVLESKLQNKEFVQIGTVADNPNGGIMCVTINQIMYGDLLGTGSNIIALMVGSDMSEIIIFNSDGTISIRD